MWKNELRFTLLAFLLLFLLPCLYPQSTSSDQIIISRNELSLLNSNLLKLSLLSQSLDRQMKVLQLDSSNLLTQLEGLRKEKEALDEQLVSLEKELTSLRGEYEGSLMDLMRLTEQLGKLEHSYRTLLASFELYKKEVNKTIMALKAEKALLTGTTVVGSVLTALFCILWAIEKFGG
jgi:chromosome segregation ATPase